MKQKGERKSRLKRVLSILAFFTGILTAPGILIGLVGTIFFLFGTVTGIFIVGIKSLLMTSYILFFLLVLLLGVLPWRIYILLKREWNPTSKICILIMLGLLLFLVVYLYLLFNAIITLSGHPPTWLFPFRVLLPLLNDAQEFLIRHLT